MDRHNQPGMHAPLLHAGRRLLAFACAILLATSARAQLVNDGATNTLSNVTTNITGNVTVGTNGSFTLLVLSDNVLLTNLGNGTIGLNTTAKSNEVQLLSASARWEIGSTLFVGSNGAFNRLVVSNGATVRAALAFVGARAAASNNVAVVTGSGSAWSNAAGFFVGANSGSGDSGAGNQLVVSNGGLLQNGGAGGLGGSVNSSNNLAVVTGIGSTWTNAGDLYVGINGVGNQLLVSNGGMVVNATGFLGGSATGSNNLTVVTDTGSVWNNRSDLRVGDLSAGNRLIVSNGGTVAASNMFVGFNATSTNNRVVVDGGTLRVTNLAGNGTLDVRRGTNVLNAGLVEADQLLVTNAAGRFEFNSGTLSCQNTFMNNGQSFGVGDGVKPAIFNLVGNGSHAFGNGLFVSNNAALTGNGFTFGTISVRSGGALSPGTSVGKIIFNNPPLLQGATVMDISKNGSVLTNDQIQVTGTLTYGGSLAVSNIGPTALAAGDRFNLFDATSYGGSFVSLSLPPLGSGLFWKNNLNVDGSIAVNTQFVQQAYVKASNTSGFLEAGDQFGASVALSGDTLVVGALYEASNAAGVNGDQTNNAATGAGAAYVFVRDGTNWTQQAYLKASNTEANDNFGTSVAVSGDTIVVGAPFEDSSATGVNGDGSNNTGTNSGAAYVFVRSGTNWTQQAYLKASNAEGVDTFGTSVAISGDTILVGAPFEDSNVTGVNANGNNNSSSNSGAAYVFARSGTNWTQQAYLKASNTGTNDFFGYAVALSGDTAVVGAAGIGPALNFGGEDSGATGVNGDGNNNNASDSGAAYVFVRSGTNWSQQAYLKASNTGADDLFGFAVAVSGNTVVVGALGEDSNATGVNGNQTNNSALSSGAAYVFVRNGTSWSQQAYLKASNTGSSDVFGYAVAVAGDTIVIGAGGEDSNATGVNGDQSNNNADTSGAAYIFLRSGSTWSFKDYLKASNTGAQDRFGISVAASGDTTAIGAIGESSNATGVNGCQFCDIASFSGAAYVFVMLQEAPPLLSIVLSGISQVTLSWTPPTSGFSLQETLTLSPVSWSNSPSGQTNPITLPVTGQSKFFRLFKP